MNLFQLFLEGASRDPHKAAVIDEGCPLSFHNLIRGAEGLANVIRPLTDCETVGIFLPNGKEFVLSYLGILAAGRATLPFDVSLKDEGIEFVAGDSGIDTVVTSRRFLEVRGREEAIRRAIPKVVCLEDMAELLVRGAVYHPPVAGEEDLAMLLYTSGSTGRPKGVRLTHRNLVSDVLASVEAACYRRGDTALQMLPLFHGFALTVTMFVPLAMSGTAVTVRRFFPETVLDLIERYRVNLLVSIPSMYGSLVQSQRRKPRDVSSLTCAISGAEPLPAAVRESFKDVFGVELLEGYGLTEASPVVSLNPPERNRPGSVGLPLPGAEIRVVDDSRQPLPANSIGDIQVRGPMVMAGYHGQPTETAKALSPDGWLATGDMGYLDADGFLWVTGRRKEMMKVGGEQVYPAEIEDRLSQHPTVAEVGVISIPDKRRGESPKAVVVKVNGSQVTAEELQRFCRDKLAPFKVPREIEFVDELPYGPTGKVNRRLLKERENWRRGKLGFVIDRAPDGRSGPGVRVGCAEDLERLRTEGVVAVVSLTEAHPDRGELDRQGLEYEHLPVPDVLPPPGEQVERFVGFVRRVRQKGGGGVFVYFSAAGGAAGTLLACFLVSEGRSAEEAMGEARGLQPECIESDAHEEVVRAWERHERG